MYSSEVIAELKNDIGSYVISDMRKVMELIFVSERVVFLDTGVVSRIGNKDWESEGCACIESIIDSGNQSKCVFIITELVLYELKDSISDVIQKHNRDLIINMYSAAYKIGILCEEITVETIHIYLNTSISVFNESFVKRLKENRPFLRTVDKLVSEDIKRRRLLEDRYKIPIKNDFISECIIWLKNNKNNRDSLAEQILALCLLMFLDMPGRTQYLFCTNDKKARVNLLKIVRTSHLDEKDRVGVVMLEGM